MLLFIRGKEGLGENLFFRGGGKKKGLKRRKSV